VEEVKGLSLVLGLILSSSIAFSQLVCGGTAQQCRDSLKKVCAAERASNIDLTGIQRLHGMFRDQTGASFTTNYAVEIRDPATGHILQSASLDSTGNFSFKHLAFSRVNLILVSMAQGQPKRTGFETPSRLQCERSDDCKLEIVLKAGATDQAKDQCPLN
jgi:hypothetical protein